MISKTRLKAVLTVIKLIVHNADLSAEAKVELIRDELKTFDNKLVK